MRLEIPVTTEPEVIRHAVELGIELKQHVFDTMYHAVALTTTGALLITADDRYFRAARGIGRIRNLLDLE